MLITIPGSFGKFRNIFLTSVVANHKTSEEVLSVEVSGVEEEETGDTCYQWTLTGDWRLPPAKVRMEALQTERPSCWASLLGLRHTQFNISLLSCSWFYFIFISMFFSLISIPSSLLIGFPHCQHNGTVSLPSK